MPSICLLKYFKKAFAYGLHTQNSLVNRTLTFRGTGVTKIELNLPG